MTTKTKRPTVASAMAGLNELAQQVRTNQTELNENIRKVNCDLQRQLEHLGQSERENRERIKKDVDELRLDVDRKNNALTGRIDEIRGIINSSVTEIKKTVTTLQDARDTKPASEPPILVSGVPAPAFSWAAFKAGPWYPWARTACRVVVLVLAYHFLVAPLLVRSLTPSVLPHLVRPSFDLSTPAGIASREVSRDPFRRDTASRVEFGRIFARLDELVRTGRITDFEGYYNEFRRNMEHAVHGQRYDEWSGVWNRIAAVCHRYGGRPNDLRQFNANLQEAARIVAGTDAVADVGLPERNLSAAGTDGPASATPTYPASDRPFLPNFSPLTTR